MNGEQNKNSKKRSRGGAAAAAGLVNAPEDLPQNEMAPVTKRPRRAVSKKKSYTL